MTLINKSIFNIFMHVLCVYTSTSFITIYNLDDQTKGFNIDHEIRIKSFSTLYTIMN